ncbi:MAG TPA: hypothetical protein VKP11_08580 [Frankiaceae bacterium]|nr:hypothetical protein [Frankiaceae bacterium]
MPVTNWVADLAVAARKAVSSTPSPSTPASRAGLSTSGRPRSSTARHTVAQPTPSSRATAAVLRPPRPTCTNAHSPARSVKAARDRIAGEVSV